jgi:rubredoxin
MQLNHKSYKCPKCGWVHAAIPLASAQKQVQTVNEWHVSKGEPATQEIASYMHCFKCGAPTIDFVPALPGDVPFGTTIQAAVVPGAWE